jgi:glycerophosphoryl diester phosphodiesterase
MMPVLFAVAQESFMRLPHITIVKLTLASCLLATAHADEHGVQMPARGICAHRGASQTHPENTLAAFREAIRLGAHMIEFDVALTKDGQLVLMHDATVDRTTDGSGLVSDMKLAELIALDAGSWKGAEFKDERVPTLDEALGMMPENIWLNVHLKGSVELAEKVTRRIVAHRRLHQAFLACGSEAAGAANRVDPRIKICNMERQANTLEYVNETIDMKAEFIQLLGGKSVDPAHTRRLREHGVRINYCCANEAEKVHALFEAGVEFPLVDRVGEMLKVADRFDIERLRPVYRPPFRVAPSLFDSSNSKTLGLQTIDGRHALLYQATDDGYKFCHHPNLAVFHDQLYCMWSNGLVDEDAPGQRILYSRSLDGQIWTEPVVLTDDRKGKGICVAAGFHVAGNMLFAYYTATGGQNFHPDTALMARTSRDGKMWSSPCRITSGFFIEGPRRLGNGRLLLAGEHVGDARKTKRMRVLLADRRDGLGGWQDARIEPSDLKVFGYTEPSPYLRRDGTLVMALRNYSGHLYASQSMDNGQTWSVPTRTNFPDSTARISAGNLPDGTAYLINNPGPKQFDRSLLAIALSQDGVTFDRAFLIRSERTKRRYDGRHKLDGWQYPNSIVWKGGLLVAYSINKEDIGLMQIALKDLTGD